MKRALSDLESIIRAALLDFAERSLICPWYGKEHNWVSLFAFSYLVKACRPNAPLYDPGQIAIEVGVPQPPGYTRGSVRRDIVIWPKPDSSCWDSDGESLFHPAAILEWKVHRFGHRNRQVAREREWLRRYTAWQKTVLGYAVEIEAGAEPRSMRVSRFLGAVEEADWIVC